MSVWCFGFLLMDIMLSLPLNKISTLDNECAILYGIEANNSIKYETCFNNIVCPYNSTIKQFCNGHGICAYNGTCICDRDSKDVENNYGGIDCSIQYELFEPYWLIRYSMLVIGIIVVVVALGLMIWTHVYRKIAEVKASSLTFTQLSLIGCILLSIHSIIISLGYNEISCVLVEWFGALGSWYVNCVSL